MKTTQQLVQLALDHMFGSIPFEDCQSHRRAWLQGALGESPDPPISRWNTGADYSEHGQRIGACLIDGRVVFADIDRCVYGTLPDTLTAPTRSDVMRCYLLGDFQQCSPASHVLLDVLQDQPWHPDFARVNQPDYPDFAGRNQWLC